MEIDTKPFGIIEIEDKQLIEFPIGLPGFETFTKFALLDSGQPPFYWLQSLDDVNVAFILINPFLFLPEYNVDIDDREFESVGLVSDSELMLIFSIVTVRNEGTMVTANLQGPIVINPQQRLGRQFITNNPQWELRYDIMESLIKMRDDDADINSKKE